jgi:DNA-binding helix-hairpin-helix protein with protein kinase domain
MPDLDLAPLVRADGRTLRLDPALLLGAGGEARVFAVPGDAGRVAKVYHRPTGEHARKIARMIADPPVLGAGDGVRLAWPEEVLSDERGRLAGFVMPRAEGPRIFEFYNPVTRRAQAPLFHYGLLHRAGAHLAAAFAALHARGYVVGDVNESNILVASDGRVSLVDTDSFQVPDAAAVLRSGVGRPEFTPPELQGVAFAEVDRAPEHDLFGLGVLIFLLLMEGTHPFAVRAAEGDPLPLEERIRAGMFPHAGDRGCAPPRLAPAFGILHPLVRELFERCFVEGHADPSARPTATQWRAVLAMAELELERCGDNPQHRHARHLDRCPWCERAALLRGRDPFPVTAEVARVASPVRTPGTVRVPVAPKTAAPLAPPLPPPRRPVLTFHRNQPLAYRAAVAVRDSVGDPVVWIAPLLMAAMASTGWLAMVLFVTAMEALYFAGKPRAFQRIWRQLVGTSLALVAALLAALAML